MKLFVKLSLITLLGFPLFSNGSPLIQAETSINKQQSQTTLQEANRLFVEGSRTSNVQLIRQAKDKYSLWLNENDTTAKNEELVQALRSRASISIVLDDLDSAISDYKKSNQYDPIGEIQLGICFLEKKQGTKSTDLHNCYAEAVQIFAAHQTAKTDINYLIARILSGDKTAITEYKRAIQTELDSDRQEMYEMAAQEYLDKTDCQQILTNCEKDN